MGSWGGKVEKKKGKGKNKNKNGRRRFWRKNGENGGMKIKISESGALAENGSGVVERA